MTKRGQTYSDCHSMDIGKPVYALGPKDLGLEIVIGVFFVITNLRN